MLFSILIVTYRRPDLLAETLESVVACEPPAEEILVIDGDESHSAEPVVQRFADRANVRYLTSAPSLSIQRNRGMAVATGDVFVFLDDDVLVRPDLFAVLREVYAEGSIVGATGRIVQYNPRRFGRPESRVRRFLFPGGAEGTMTSFGYPRRILDPTRPRDVEWMPGCFISARSDRAREVGFDEDITAELEGEDEDFAYRLSRMGRLRFEPRATIEHKQLGFKTKSGSRRFDRDIVIVRSYLFRKNFRRTAKSRLQFAALIAVLLAHRIVNREWQGARGVIEGVVHVLRNRGRPLLHPARTRAVIGPRIEAEVGKKTG